MALLLLVPCHPPFTLRYTWYRVVGQLPPTPFPPGLHVTVADVPVASTSTVIYAAALGLMLGVAVGVAVAVGVGVSVAAGSGVLVAVAVAVGVALAVGVKVVEAVAVKSRLAEDSEKPLQELP